MTVADILRSMFIQESAKKFRATYIIHRVSVGIKERKRASS
jgi:hypothetical protein